MKQPVSTTEINPFDVQHQKMKGFAKLDGGISQKALKIAKKRNSYVPMLNQVNRN